MCEHRRTPHTQRQPAKRRDDQPRPSGPSWFKFPYPVVGDQAIFQKSQSYYDSHDQWAAALPKLVSGGTQFGLSCRSAFCACLSERPVSKHMDGDAQVALRRCRTASGGHQHCAPER